MQATISPSLLQPAYQPSSGSVPWTSQRTSQQWVDIIELFIRASTQSLSTLPIDTRFAPAVVATGDGGAILINSEAGPSPYRYRYLQQYRYFARNLARTRQGAQALQPARIIDATLEEIRQPHLEALHWIKQATGFSQERISELVGVSRQTLNRWQRGEPIKDTNRQRVFAVRSVLERALIRHRTRPELVAWLDTPRGADGRTPAQCFAAGDIDRARLLALSVPSPQVKRAPSWVRRPVPPAFRAGGEHEQQALPPEPPIEQERDAPASDEPSGER